MSGSGANLSSPSINKRRPGHDCARRDLGRDCEELQRKSHDYQLAGRCDFYAIAPGKLSPVAKIPWCWTLSSLSCRCFIFFLGSNLKVPIIGRDFSFLRSEAVKNGRDQRGIEAFPIGAAAALNFNFL